MADHHEHDHPGLDVKVERTGPCSATVRFTVTQDEFRRARQQGLKHYAKRTRVKGFRPGKVPASFVEKQFGQAIDRELVEHFVQHAFQHAVEDEGLRPAINPRIDLESIEASSDADWGHEFELVLRPDVELGEIKGLSIERQDLQISDEELDGALEGIRRELSVPEPAGDEGLTEDGMAVCTLEFLRSEGDEPVLRREGIRMNTKTAPPGIEAGAFEEALSGARAGDVHELDYEFPEDFPEEDVRGGKGRLRITLDECFKIVPPDDERVFKEFEAEDDAGLRTEVTRRMLEAKTEQEERRIEHELFERVLAQHPMEVPEELVASQVEHKVADIRSALEAQGLPEADIEQQLQTEREAARELSAKALRAVYLMEEIARTHGLDVTSEDVEGEFRAIAARNGVDVAQVRKYYQEERLLQQLAIELLERRVRSFLRESADITGAGASEPEPSRADG